MAENTPKRKIRDSVFTNLFQEKKYLLQLYKALHPEDGEATEDEIAGLVESFHGSPPFLRRCYGDTFYKGKISESVLRLHFQGDKAA